jgi:hypothetical protein
VDLKGKDHSHVSIGSVATQRKGSLNPTILQSRRTNSPPNNPDGT